MRHVRRILGHVAAAVLCTTAAVMASAQAPTVADAARRGDMAALRAMLVTGTDASAAPGDGMTALHWAAERGDAAMVNLLVAAGASVSARTRIGDYTPLHLAATQGGIAAVRALLAAGVSA